MGETDFLSNLAISEDGNLFVMVLNNTDVEYHQYECAHVLVYDSKQKSRGLAKLPFYDCWVDAVSATSTGNIMMIGCSFLGNGYEHWGVDHCACRSYSYYYSYQTQTWRTRFVKPIPVLCRFGSVISGDGWTVAYVSSHDDNYRVGVKTYDF